VAKNIASLAAQVSANIAPFEQGMTRVQTTAKSTANAVNSTRMTANLDTAKAEAQLATLKAKAAKPVVTPVMTAGADGVRTGLKMPGGLNPANVSIAVLSASVMRAVQQSEAGKKMIERIDSLTQSLITPALRVITPLLELLAPAIQLLVPPLTEVAEGVENLAAKIQEWINNIPGANTPGASSTLSNIGPRVGLAFVTAGLSEAVIAANRLIQMTSDQRPASASIGAPGGPTFASAMTSIMGLAAANTQTFQTMQASLQNQLSGGGFAVQMQQMQQNFQNQIQPLQQQLQNSLNSWNPAATAIASQLQAQIQVLQQQHQTQVQKLQAMNQEVQAQQRITQMQQRAAQITQGTISPMQNFQNNIAEINRLQGAGLLAQGAANAAIAQQWQNLQATLPQAPNAGPAALQEGTTAAVQAILAAQRQQQQPNLQTQMRDFLRQIEQREATQVSQNEQIIKQLQNLGVLNVGRVRPN